MIFRGAVSALMPAIHDRLTGGSLFNNRILAEIGKSAAVELHVEPHVQPRVEPHMDTPDRDGPQPGSGIWLVDSLCLEAGAAHLRRCPEATGVLIAHYLKLVDPRHRQSREAEAELAALHAYRAVIITSGFSRRALIESGFCGRVEAISPGLDNSYRRPVPPRHEDSHRILTVGSLLPDKGLLEMLAALDDLRDFDWSWEVIGDAGLDTAFTTEFHGRLRRFPGKHRVLMSGTLPPDRVEAAYDRADIFALPSRFETCSMATMEAMARGLPVVAFRVGGLPDLLPEASRQLLADAGDMDQFAAALRFLLADADLRHSLGERNRAASIRFSGWEATGLKVITLLGELSEKSVR